MASGGPAQDNTALFEKIVGAKGAEKQAMMKALSPALQAEFVKHLKFSIASKKVVRLETDIAALDAREAALMHEDKSVLVQASSSYAPKVGDVQTTVPKEPATGSAPRYGSKFNQ